jgi:hypothetical protein
MAGLSQVGVPTAALLELFDCMRQHVELREQLRHR